MAEETPRVFEACLCSNDEIKVSNSFDEDAPLCVVCLEKKRNTRLPCGHEIMCSSCAVVVLKLKPYCPACRTKFHKIKFSSAFGKRDFVMPRSSEENLFSCSAALRCDTFSEQRVSPIKVTQMQHVDGIKLILDGSCRVYDQLSKLCSRISEPDCEISSISLTNNYIGPEEAHLLADALAKNHSIRFLSLSNNQLGPEGAKIILEALTFNDTMKELHLNSNKIGKEGASYVASLLSKNTPLEILRLYDNHIGDQGCRLIGKALKLNYVLKEINLRSNLISAMELKCLADRLHKNLTLEKIDIGLNEPVRKRIFPMKLQVNTSPF